MYSQVITAIAIHLLMPLAGFAVFCWLYFHMRRAGIPAPPFVSYFILFATFGGWLLVALTVLFWEWSGMASLGVFYLVFVAPRITAVLAWRLRQRRADSGFHRAAFWTSAAYSGLILVLDVIWRGFFTTSRHS